MKCLMKYQWVKLPRDQMPPSKGIMGAWARLAAIELDPSYHRFLGWRNCWPQEHLGYQEPKKGPGNDEQTDPVGLHRL